MQTKKKISKGCFVVSEPFLFDPHFKRTVVLLCEHDQNNGTVGFITNRKTQNKLSDTMSSLTDFDAPLFYGGPVQTNTLHFLHTLGADAIDDSFEVMPNVFWGGNFEQLLAKINLNEVQPSQVKFFIGYAGWTAGQLAQEMKDKTWILTSADKEIVFADNPNNAWRATMNALGGQYKIMANFPEDPQLN